MWVQRSLGRVGEKSQDPLRETKIAPLALDYESTRTHLDTINPFAPGDFAQKRVLKLVEWFSGHCRAIKS